MQNIVDNINTTVDTVQQLNNVEMTSNLALLLVMVGIISFIVYVVNIYRKVETIIDERIDAKIRPSVDILHETVETVRHLEHAVTEVNATLILLKDIIIKESKKL